MSKNNQLYNAFNNLIKGYAIGDEVAIEQNATNLCQLAENNPFTYDTEEYEKFYQMQRSCRLWLKNGVDHKINRRKMIGYAKELCALNPKQPYIYDKKADEEEKKQILEAENARIAKVNSIEEINKTEVVQKVELEEPVHMTGVIPEEDKEKKSWTKFLFPWK